MLSVDSLIAILAPDHPPAPWQRRLLSRLLKEHVFQDFARQYPHLKGLEMVEQVLEYLEVSCELSERDLEQIPSHGPVVLVANHPMGTLDGLALLLAVSRVRRDVKVVANRLLNCLTPLAGLFIAVDNLGGRNGRVPLIQMQAQLADDGVLIFFPAGEVSRAGSKGVRDGRWHHSFIKLAAKHRAPIVPVYIRGRNSALFYLTSLVNASLATLLLVREMFRQRGSRITLRIGARVPFASWHDGHTPATILAKRFRCHVYRLAQDKKGLFQTESAIARAEDRAVLRRALLQCESLGALPDGKRIWLYRRGDEESSPILRELGRLREIAFRAVGEGSGKRRDCDAYDDHYYHLILWDDEALEIVGAYRLMPTAARIARSGVAGLYSHSLFHYSNRMDPILRQGVELGRSFIQPCYWGRRGLDYLWLGIGAWLARHPQYRYLFGPVSISASMPLAARDLLVAFYRIWFPPALPLATSRHPWPASLPDVLAQFGGEDYAADLALLRRLLANLGCAIPPLYKQYAELCEPGGVQFIDFGSDPDFNHCIDGLVLVDVEKLKPQRYQRYISIHRPPDS
ncbi:lysophospholipid acyltransferase family protein [Pantoea sp. 1.19]|uniref:lysophospholipid acyltransferase family protein n=1 Tax=Pantoea sp. 1.19 TaxID=1925589 RepID=UPI000948D8E0|nr:lysophospholipid acyltransferase family protein [Pantoea sp. 1.19]